MRFSRRVPASLEPNALSRALAEARLRGRRIIDLTEANPTHAGIPYDWPAIARALGDARGASYDPNPLGAPIARRAVAAYYAARGVDVSEGRVVLCASTSEAYAWSFKLLCDPGDVVLVPSPSYPLLEHLASLEAVVTETYPLVYHDGWSIDLAALEARIHERTRAILVVHPNNPTGHYASRREVEALSAIATDRGIALVSDEVFLDYPFDERADESRAGTLAGEHAAPTLVLSGLSKAAGLPQLKLGWTVLAGPDAAVARMRERLELIADTFLSVATPVMLAAPTLLQIGETNARRIRERVRENLAHLDRALEGSACSRLRAEGGWSATIRIPAIPDDESFVLGLLGERCVLAYPGHFFDFEGGPCVVVSLCTPTETFREGVEAIVQHAAALP
jgi:hypothetical protein